MYDVYVPLPSDRIITRSGPRFQWNHSAYGPSPGTHYASVRPIDQMTVTLHSSIAMPRALTQPTNFWHVLRSFENQSLFNNFVCDGDGEWIHRGLIMGSLVICHDGSYQPLLATDVCSAAFMIYCRHTGYRAKGVIAERSSDADNYRAEILGGLMVQLVLRAATRSAASPYRPVIVDCDNMGVVNHGNSFRDPLPIGQSQADVLRSFKLLVADNPLPVRLRWVQGHALKNKKWEQCTLPEKVNDIVDRLANDGLIEAFTKDEYITSYYPFDNAALYLDGKKVSGSPVTALERHWGYKEAKTFYNAEHIIDSENFHLVWWEGVGATSQHAPKLFRNWVTKHISESCGTNLRLSYWSDVLPNCPDCGEAEETSMHLTRCHAEGRTAMLRLSIQEIVSWMTDTYADQYLISMVEEYLLAQGSKTMLECVPIYDNDLELVAHITDRLGWDSFVEGRLGKVWIELMRPVLIASPLRMTVVTWGRTFIEKLLSLTHKQWILRNSKKHYRRPDGLTETEHAEIFDRIDELLHTTAADLLPRHRHLLNVDFLSLGEGPVADRQQWIASMQSALSAAQHVRSGCPVSSASLRRFNTARRPRRTCPRVRSRPSTSGSVVYRHSFGQIDTRVSTTET